MKIRRNIYFHLDKEADKPDARLKCRVTWNGNTVSFAVGFRVAIAGWESSAQRCKPRSRHGKMQTPGNVINREIESLTESVDRIFSDFEDSGLAPTKAEMKARLDGLLQRNVHAEDKSIFPAFDAYIADGEATDKWHGSSLKKIQTARMHLHSISPTLSFDELDRNGAALIIDHFAKMKGLSVTRNEDNHKERTEGMSNVSVQKNLSIIRAFLRWAIDNGWCDSCRLADQRIRLRTARKMVIYLTWEELMKVYAYDFSSQPYLDRVRDVFCFCCFTSLRYSDVAGLKKSDIGEDSVTIVTQKTNDRLVIELNKYSKAIWDKYRDWMIDGGLAFPVISNQKMNAYLKQIGKTCGIDTPVTITTFRGMKRIDETVPKWQVMSSHCARRTFVTNALSLGISPSIVMKWTGHKDYSAMRPYIDIVDAAKKSAMEEFDKR